MILIPNKKVFFREWECDVWLSCYMTTPARLAIILQSLNGEPIATATANIVEESMADDEVIIKDYSENEGMAQALVNAGVIEQPHRSCVLGYLTHEVKYPIAKLKVERVHIDRVRRIVEAA